MSDRRRRSRARCSLRRPRDDLTVPLLARFRPTKTRPSRDRHASPPARRDDLASVSPSAVAHDPATVSQREKALRSPHAAIAVDAHAIAGANRARHAVDVDHARHAELARDDRRVRERSAELGDHARGDQEQRRPPDVGRVHDEHLAGLKLAHLRRREEHARDALRRRRRSRARPRSTSPPAGGSTTGGGAPMNVAGGSGRAWSRANSARRARTSGARSVREVRSAWTTSSTVRKKRRLQPSSASRWPASAR